MFSEATKNSLNIKKAPFLCALLSLVLAFSLLVSCKEDTKDCCAPALVTCTVGDDSPCELWQRCLGTEGAQGDQGDQGHCIGERQCETDDNCSDGKTCKSGSCVPASYCEVGCPQGEFVCVSPELGCQPGCFENGNCSDSRVCGGHDTTTGLGACRNPKQGPEST
ncbi:MAG: hypothetical protein FWG75_01765 [Cystobacterineae bacterium]|nr:hypothetical protein [Cystobacterineae bacterium]